MNDIEDSTGSSSTGSSEPEVINNISSDDDNSNSISSDDDNGRVKEIIDVCSTSDDSDFNDFSSSRKRRRSAASIGSGGTPTHGPTRFFDEEDITTRCYRCGGIGHISTECVNEPLKRACFRCGENGHSSRSCTNEICYNCFSTGK